MAGARAGSGPRGGAARLGGRRAARQGGRGRRAGRSAGGAVHRAPERRPGRHPGRDRAAAGVAPREPGGRAGAAAPAVRTAACHAAPAHRRGGPRDHAARPGGVDAVGSGAALGDRARAPARTPGAGLCVAAADAGAGRAGAGAARPPARPGAAARRASAGGGGAARRARRAAAAGAGAARRPRAKRGDPRTGAGRGRVAPSHRGARTAVGHRVGAAGGGGQHRGRVDAADEHRAREFGAGGAPVLPEPGDRFRAPRPAGPDPLPGVPLPEVRPPARHGRIGVAHRGESGGTARADRRPQHPGGERRAGLPHHGHRGSPGDRCLRSPAAAGRGHAAGGGHRPGTTAALRVDARAAVDADSRSSTRAPTARGSSAALRAPPSTTRSPRCRWATRP